MSAAGGGGATEVMVEQRAHRTFWAPYKVQITETHAAPVIILIIACITRIFLH
jgi:hypothetical protein